MDTKSRHFYRLLVGSLLALISLASCSDSLNQEPKLNLTSSAIFSDSTHIEANLLGIYESAKSLMATRLFAANEARGNDFINLSVNSYEMYDEYYMIIGLTSSDNNSFWTGLYETINNANTFLANIKNAQSAAGEKYGQYTAEAKFLRALSYYYLNDLYAEPYVIDPNAKSVPLRLNAENSTNGNDLTRSTVSEIYQQILNDLSDESIANLPASLGTYNSETRASQAAAHVLRQRIYLEEGEWEKAIEEGNAVKGYSLENDPKTNFQSSVSTSEVIFTWPMSTTNRGGNQTSASFYFRTGTNLVIDSHSGIFSSPAYSQKADKRVTELIDYDSNHGQYLSAKFTDAQTYLDWIPVFRYAEVLLNNAEACYNIGDEANARSYLT